MVSSLSTLDRLVAHDSVDDIFRYFFLLRKTVRNSMALAAGAGLEALSISQMADDGIGAGYCILAAAAGVPLGFSVAGLVKAARTAREFRRERKSGLEKSRDFYYIGGKLSKHETAVERNYGLKIKPACSLDDLGDDSHGLKDDSPGMFIDHLLVSHSGICRTEDFELIPAPEPETHFFTYVSGELILKRGSEEKRLGFRYRDHIPGNVKRLMSLHRREVAMVVSSIGNRGGVKGDELFLPFDVERMYFPNQY